MQEESFELKYKTIDGVTAIWYRLQEVDWIVDPCVLFNGILQGEGVETALLYLNVENLEKRRPTFYVKQEYNGNQFIWTISELFKIPDCKIFYNYKEFLKKATKVFDALCKDREAGKATAYDKTIKTEELVTIVNQMPALSLFYMPKRPRTSEINVEKFKLICPNKDDRCYDEDWAMDIPYTVKIGDRSISSYISEWSNSISHIRHQLEGYYYDNTSAVRLRFEDEPTVINLKHERTLKSAESSYGGTSYKYDDFVKVVVQPNSFVKGLAISGYCDEKETIRELYEGLLNVGRVGYKYDAYWHEPWSGDSICFYNEIKSPVIERYLDGIHVKDNTIEERQRVIHHIFTISPDYPHVLGQMTGQDFVTDVYDDDMVTLYDNEEKEICSVKLPGIYNWLSEFEWHSDGVNSTMGTIDTKSWHHRGLILAKELKKLLPDDIDIWYGYPFEDVEHRDSRPILITDGTLKDYFEEELAKACLKKDKARIEYCLRMDADINANDGAAFLNLITSEDSIDNLTDDELAAINAQKLELFEYMHDNGLIINNCIGGIDTVRKACCKWKCKPIEDRVNEIYSRI